MKIYLETYGCAANQAHSEVMRGLLSRAGCDLVENEELADVLILNSCIVKSPTENRIIHRLKELEEKYSEKDLILAGCMPQAEYERAREFAPEASFVGPNNCKDIAKAVRKTAEGGQVEYLEGKREEKLCLPRIRNNKLVDICEIAQGCVGNCSYCQVKDAKGELRSYSPQKILEEVKQSLRTGCKEVWLTAQDTAAYERDIGTDLAELLEQVVKLRGNFRTRIGMMNTNTAKPILGDLIEKYKNEEVYSFLHLPLQSGSDPVLDKMNRKYTVDEFVRIVERFREEIPKLNFWTDIIVGFPGEDEEDYEKSKEVLKELKPDTVNVSRFGARPGTEAKEMNQIPSDVKKGRSKEISKLVEEISRERKEEILGTTRKILVTEKGNKPNQWKGRDETYRTVLVKSGEDLLGKFVSVKIVDSEEGNLYGERT